VILGWSALPCGCGSRRETTAIIAETLRQLTLASRQEEGCVNYIAHFVESDPATVVLYEQYVDEEALEIIAILPTSCSLPRAACTC
jgi:hypothetical protein